MSKAKKPGWYRLSLVERLWARTEKTETCWIWTGATDNHGYGGIRMNGRLFKCHRVAWSAVNGDAEIPPGMHVCHRCDNPICVRPEHLFLGTRAENFDDAARKFRLRRKLTPELVREIREHLLSKSKEQVAEMFKISRSMTYLIADRKAWKYA